MFFWLPPNTGGAGSPETEDSQGAPAPGESTNSSRRSRRLPSQPSQKLPQWPAPNPSTLPPSLPPSSHPVQRLTARAVGGVNARPRRRQRFNHGNVPLAGRHVARAPAVCSPAGGWLLGAQLVEKAGTRARLAQRAGTRAWLVKGQATEFGLWTRQAPELSLCYAAQSAGQLLYPAIESRSPPGLAAASPPPSLRPASSAVQCSALPDMWLAPARGTRGS